MVSTGRVALRWAGAVVLAEAILVAAVFDRFAWQYNNLEFGDVVLFVVLSVLSAGVLLLFEMNRALRRNSVTDAPRQ